MSEELRPAQLTPPGRILKQEIEARGWTQRDLAAILDRPEQTISEIVTGTKQITPETSVELGQAFGTSPEFWLNLEAHYRLELARRLTPDDAIARRSRLYSELPLREMARRGWLTLCEPVDRLEQEVERCLGVPVLPEPPFLTARLRGSSIYLPLTYAQLAWLRRAETLARAQTAVGEWRADNIELLVRELSGRMRLTEGVAEAPSILARWGIRFVVLRCLEKSYLDGAAFWNGQHPVIALTLRCDHIDAFWFTLMHELAHLLEGSNSVSIDRLEDGDNEDGAATDIAADAHEDTANRLASRWLIDPEAFSRFVAGTAPHFSRARIEVFSAEQARHPGIILGRLQRDRLVPYRNLRGLLVKVSPMLTPYIND